MRSQFPLTLAALALVAVGTALRAEVPTTSSPAAASSGAKPGAADPNRTICRKIETIGSRLRAQRVCRTAAEWEAQRASDRQAIERSQTQRTKAD